MLGWNSKCLLPKIHLRFSHPASSHCALSTYLQLSLSQLSLQLVAPCEERLRTIRKLSIQQFSCTRTLMAVLRGTPSTWLRLFCSPMALIWESEKHERKVGSVTNITSQKRKEQGGHESAEFFSNKEALSTTQKPFCTPQPLLLLRLGPAELDGFLQIF